MYIFYSFKIKGPKWSKNCEISPKSPFYTYTSSLYTSYISVNSDVSRETKSKLKRPDICHPLSDYGLKNWSVFGSKPRKISRESFITVNYTVLSRGWIIECVLRGWKCQNTRNSAECMKNCNFSEYFRLIDDRLNLAQRDRYIFNRSTILADFLWNKIYCLEKGLKSEAKIRDPFLAKIRYSGYFKKGTSHFLTRSVK